MANLRLVLTGIEAFVAETYDKSKSIFSFPLSVLLPNGQEARPAQTRGAKGEDRVIPSHHAFLQFRVSDLDPKTTRRPDLSHSRDGIEYGVCKVDGEFLKLPDLVKTSKPLTAQSVPESVTDFAKVCDHAEVTNDMLSTKPNSKMISARLDIPAGVLKPNEHDAYGATPTNWTFKPLMEGMTQGATLEMKRRPCVEWPIPVGEIGNFEITSKPLEGGDPRPPLRFVNRGKDVEILLANIPSDSLLHIRRCCQDIDTHFELYYLLFTHRAGPLHVPHRVSVEAGPEGGDCGPVVLRRAAEA